MLVGIVEGFYGPRWDLLDRLSIVSFMGRVGLNLYFYAPKDDPYHRAFWRSPYPPQYLEEFSTIIEACNRFGVAFAYAISPGLDIDYSSKSDLDILVRKLGRFLDLGARIVGVFLDDIPEELRGGGYKSLAEAQAVLANKVLWELAPDKLFLVPTRYWGYDRQYLGELGSILDKNVEIVWTGRYVVSPTIASEDLEGFREIAGRYPAIWDNYPVNDFFTVRGYLRLHMGAIKGREPGIFGLAPAYMANPMNQAEASKIPIYMVARASKGVTPGIKDLEEAVELVVDEDLWEELKLFTLLNSSSVLDPEADLEVGPNNAREIIGMIESLRKKLRNRKLLHEINPVLSFLEQLARTVMAGGKLSGAPRIQSAGLYDPPISDEAMVRVFGRIARRRPSWAA